MKEPANHDVICETDHLVLFFGSDSYCPCWGLLLSAQFNLHSEVGCGGYSRGSTPSMSSNSLRVGMFAES